ncbi:MAG: amidohydrolase family protein [Rhodococcus sp. (in: high G+C Gram-positive bacteria)]|uniref:amidohydrolase family protein n=1 Tax=Rhodococcus sp. TaxID=1831 RepID=UPI002ADA3C27|nr:amidohydrolase family protein [Rhodococcus sp. (in: high G+C Gram-positive bacteria)]
MKITALEEHLMTPAILDAWRDAPGAERDNYVGNNERGALGERLLDLGQQRVDNMDATGVDVHVLSVTTPGVQNLSAEKAVPLAREANDAVRGAMDRFPTRFEGFATLPTPDPQASAAELRRCVTELGFMGAMLNGRTGDRNVDHPDYEPMWKVAAELRCPIYIHPQLPQNEVRDAYYSGYDFRTSYVFGGPVIGWHYETGIQLIRMILGGVFDRYPDLQVIVGHWGEAVLFFTERIAHVKDWTAAGLKKPVIDYFRENVSYTGSGDLSDRYLSWTKEVVGTERIMYATDYPFIDTSEGKARSWLESADLTEAEKVAIASGNWERMTAHLR